MEPNSSTEKLNDPWKDKLEDVASLQPETLRNKDVVWEKLHARLAEKPNNKKIVWYWLAAASVIAAIIISSLTIHKTTTGIASHNNTSNNVKESLAKKDEPVKNVSPGIKTTRIHEQSQKNTVVKNHEKQSTIGDTLNTTQSAGNDRQILENQTTAVPVVDTTAIATISSIPVQKKLKVVHINELGEPVEFPADVAQSSDLHLFQLKLAQQEIYHASSIASNNSSGLFFKPKNSPN